MATSRPRVYARIRPLNENERRGGATEILHPEKNQPDTLVFVKDSEPLKTRFDHVFGIDATQEGVFGHISTEVMSTLFSGYNASIFAYGQTGSGKTFTMEGAPGHPGIIPRLIQAIFDRFEDQNNEITDAVMTASFVQIYQERIQDLLNNRKQLDIHMDRSGQYIAQGATWQRVNSQHEALTMFTEAVKMRATSSTEMNLVSSRSHTILMLRMQWDEPSLPGSSAQLNLVDLAGSERIALSGAVGETMKEAIHINKSLSALGNVVSKLVDQVKMQDRRVHIPYKDSKLTYLLQSSLGGSNLVHFILALSCSSQWKHESSATIDFGKRALQLVIRPVRNAIDYKRLEEMEAMIEKMRNHIRSLEEELRTKPQASAPVAPPFLQMQAIPQEGDAAARAERRARRAFNVRRISGVKSSAQLSRIMNNLPEALEDLSSHCVLHPSSRDLFRQLGGIERLIHYIDRNASTYIRSHAAHVLAHVVDDEGRESFVKCGGMEVLSRLMAVQEERCKEAACVATESVLRSNPALRLGVPLSFFDQIVEVMFRNPNQQVQEAAATALAVLIDGNPEGKEYARKLDVVPKLLQMIRDAPAEVLHVMKAAVTCLGRLAHGDPEFQQLIASLDGVPIIVDSVLLNPVGERDHQVMILASYALVNLCCSNARNMEIVKRHPQYNNVRFRLLEGLARAFGNNAVREGFGRASAQERQSPFPYSGVTVMGKWTNLTCGGRPVYSTFMENPQYYLYVNQDVSLTLLIQDTLYDERVRKKERSFTVYMGLVVLQADVELCRAGLKQVDFHGKLVEISRFTSNCENIVFCTLPKSENPYIVVPFTSQRGRLTSFALSAFGNTDIDLVAVPESTGWVRTIIDGEWSEFTGRGGESFDWRCNPQVRIVAKDAARVVCVLSYRSVDIMRQSVSEEDGEDFENDRPRLYGRLFQYAYPSKRYIKALVPLPQGSTYVSSNAYSTNGYITTSASLQGGQAYVFVPFTELPAMDTWRLTVFSDVEEVEVTPVAGRECEWNVESFCGQWAGKALTMQVIVSGRITVIIISKDTFVRVHLQTLDGLRLAGTDSLWKGEANAEFDAGNRETQLVVVVEGSLRRGEGNSQVPADVGEFDLFVFTEKPPRVSGANFSYKPSALNVPSLSTPTESVPYPTTVPDMGVGPDTTESNAVESNDDPLEEELEEATKKNGDLQEQINSTKEENRKLLERIRALEESSAGGGGGAQPTTTVTPPSAQPPTGRQSFSRNGARVRPLAPPAGGAGAGAAGGASAGGGGGALGRAVDEALVKLHSCVLDRPPNPKEWERIKKDLRSVQMMLVDAKGKS